MKYLDINSDKISKICLGTARFGTIVDEAKSYEMMDVFFDNGGNLFDTARNYYEWDHKGRGVSEHTLGKWMNLRNNRDRIYICTKGGLKGSGQRGIVNLSKENLVLEVKESLEALNTDYIDCYLLHKDENNRAVEEIVDTMQFLSENYDIRHIGVANWKAERVIAANEYAKAQNLKPFEVVQTWWSIAEYTASMWNDPSTTYMDDKMYNYLLNNHLIGMGYTSQCKGFFQKAARDGIDSIAPILKERIVTPKNIIILEKLKVYAKEKNTTITDLVNSYITSNRLDGIAVVSCSDLEQLLDILSHCDYDLDKGTIDEIDGIKVGVNYDSI